MKTKMEIMNRIKAFSVIILLLMFNFSSTFSQTQDKEIIRTNVDGKGQKIVLTVTSGSEHNYPMMAAWIEDMEGNFLQTIYVNESVARGYFKYAVKNGGQWEPGEAVRPASLPVWAHSRGIKSGEGHYMPTRENPVPDAMTAATPQADFAVYSRAKEKLKGKVRVLFEINQSWDWNDFWTNNKYPGDQDYKTSSQPSVVYSAVIDIDDPRKEYELQPIGHGHYSGKDGKIYTDLSTLTSALQIVDRVTVSLEKE